MKKIKKADQDAKLAKKWRTKPRTIRAWRKAKAPLNKPDAVMIEWLSGQRTLPVGTALLLGESRRVNIAKDLAIESKLTKGAASALLRLEGMEVKAYEAFIQANRRGDRFEIKNAMEAWLRISGELRRFDLQVESARRSDDLVPRKVAIEGARRFVQGLRFAHNGLENCAQLVCGINDPAEVWQILRKPIGSFMVAAIASLRQTKGVPEWLLEAFEQGAEVFPGEAERSKALAEIIRGLIGTYGIQARQLFDLRTAAEEKWRTETDPSKKSEIYHSELAPLLAGKMPEQQRAPASPTAQPQQQPAA